MYNLSNIMKRAWKANRNANGKFTFAQSLKWSWKIAKEEAQGVLIKADNIVRETTKAVFVKCRCVNTNQIIKFWLPKSMVKNGIAPNWMVDKKIEDETCGMRGLSSVTFAY